ncbi:MAG: right-handed parallel beta-helix repeat-containing protein [Deltaproteobacteria bacterium]|nr:right-handed parallel beta-helix repeat-containing protein [Deltaproteobacteria bacterium]
MRREHGVMSVIRRRAMSVIGAAAWTLAASGAHATDGFVEINQICATLTGCFPGDNPGFPVMVDGSAGRHYRLSSDLTVPDGSTNGIVVAADGIEIDLGGFAVLGSVDCTGSPIVCTPSGGTGIGISAASASIRGVSVHDGSISGQGEAGIRLGDGTILRVLRVRSNGGVGVDVADGSVVLDVVVSSNGGGGIRADASRVADALVAANGGDGIHSDFGTLEGNQVVRNGGVGLAVRAAVVRSNTIEANTLDGVLDAGGSLILRNAVNGNLQDGIETGAGASLIGNVARGNGGFGIRLAAGSSFRENTVASAGAKTVANAGGLDLGANSCNGVATCP